MNSQLVPAQLLQFTVYPPNSETPRALTEVEIQQIIQDFAAATKRAILAGFDGIELHGANTYLLQQFFSANSNQQTDQWGGSLEKRMTFPLAVINAVKATIKENASDQFILGYRISPEEIETPGIRLADSLTFAQTIKPLISYLHLSMGSYQRTSLNNQDDKTPLLNQFADVTNHELPLIGIGFVETPTDAENVLAGGADLVAIGRELLREPQWVQKILSDDEASLRFKMSPNEMDELAIPRVMQVYLRESFAKVMHFTTDKTAGESYQNQVAPMEGFEKKL